MSPVVVFFSFITTLFVVMTILVIISPSMFASDYESSNGDTSNDSKTPEDWWEENGNPAQARYPFAKNDVTHSTLFINDDYD